MSVDTMIETNRELQLEFRAAHLEWWRPQREAAERANRGKSVVDAFAGYDTTNKPRLTAWVNVSQIRNFTAHLADMTKEKPKEGPNRFDKAISVEATSLSEARAFAGLIMANNRDEYQNFEIGRVTKSVDRDNG